MYSKVWELLPLHGQECITKLILPFGNDVFLLLLTVKHMAISYIINMYGPSKSQYHPHHFGLSIFVVEFFRENWNSMIEKRHVLSQPEKGKVYAELGQVFELFSKDVPEND